MSWQLPANLPLGGMAFAACTILFHHFHGRVPYILILRLLIVF
jgi:hypothetical protein